MNKRKKDKTRKMKRGKNHSLIVNNIQNGYTMNQVITQFICPECYHTSLVLEEEERQTPKYEERQILCTCCHKYTKQICIKDKALTKGILETSKEKTKEETRTLQLIKKSTGRSSE